jgi:uncharacterized protein with FMN-binding domain
VQSPDTNSNATSTTGNYKDGTYAATSKYSVPPGEESIQVTLTLSGGTITDASIQNSENDPESAQFQEDFATSYKSSVVGKKIAVLHLGNIAGASDTAQAFNDALSQITTKAQS